MGMQNVNGKWVFVESFEQKVDRAAAILSKDIEATRKEIRSISSGRNAALMTEIFKAIRSDIGKTATPIFGVPVRKSTRLSRDEMEDMGMGANTGYGWVTFTK